MLRVIILYRGSKSWYNSNYFFPLFFPPIFEEPFWNIRVVASKKAWLIIFTDLMPFSTITLISSPNVIPMVERKLWKYLGSCPWRKTLILFYSYIYGLTLESCSHHLTTYSQTISVVYFLIFAREDQWNDINIILRLVIKFWAKSSNLIQW